MTKAIALTRLRFSTRIDPLDALRSAIVLSCAAALIAAGPLLPALG